MKKAKETVGKMACISGNLATATLIVQLEGNALSERRANVLEICAPGGGFIMDASIVIDKCPKENLHAMFDTTLQYGVYKKSNPLILSRRIKMKKHNKMIALLLAVVF
jgi:uroporphyrinogen-III decarboxylase